MPALFDVFSTISFPHTHQSAVCRKTPLHKHHRNVVVSLRYATARNSSHGCASSAGHVILDLPLRPPVSQPAKCSHYCRNHSRQFNVHSREDITQAQYASSGSSSPVLCSVSRMKLTCCHTVLFVLCVHQRHRLSSQSEITAPFRLDPDSPDHHQAIKTNHTGFLHVLWSELSGPAGSVLR